MGKSFVTWCLLFTLGWHALVAEQPILELKKSEDGMANWQQVSITESMITSEGKLQLDEQGSSSVFYRLDIEVPPPPAGMVLVEGGTLPASSGLGNRMGSVQETITFQHNDSSIVDSMST
jgi:hypothetical protein